MNAPFSRLPRWGAQPVPTPFAPTLPMEALAGQAAGHEGRNQGWHETGPPTVPSWPAACEPPSSPAVPGTDLTDSDFHEPLGGLQMRELESPELFEHLFGRGAAG